MSGPWKHLSAAHLSWSVHVSGWKRLIRHMIASMSAKSSGSMIST